MTWNDFIKRLQIKRNLKRILFEQSHLTPYLPIMKENFMKKYIRIYDDKSVEENIDEKMASIQYNKLSEYSGSSYLNPLSLRILFYYVFVFAAIIFTFTETWQMYTFGLTAWEDSLTMPGFVFFRIYSIIVFSIDIYIQLHAGYLYRGMIIIDRERIKSRYLRYFFLIDLFLIFSLIISIATQQYYLNLLKIVIFLKFIRMLQIDDLYVRKLSVDTTWRVIYVIGKQFITIFILSHTVGMIFYLIDFALVNDNISGVICQGNNSLCWLYSATAFNGIINQSWPIQYFYALYWGVNTIMTISYGDIAPNNPYETIYATYMFCFGFVIMGYIVNNIIKIILWATNQKNEYRDQLILYNTYMDCLQIPREVQYEIKDYLYYKYMKESNRDLRLESQMQTKLPQELRIELLKSAYFEINNYFQSIFQSCPTVTEFLYCIEERNYTKNETVLLQGSILNRMIFQLRGQVSLSINYQNNCIKIASLNIQNEFIALYEFLLNQKAKFNITVNKESVFYFINRKKIQEIVAKYQDLNQKYKYIQYELLVKKNYKIIFYKCFYCHGNHQWYDCLDNFPNFKEVYLQLKKYKKNRPRIYQNQYKTLQNISKMRQEKVSDDIVRKMKERIMFIKKLKEKERGYFDVDAFYNWNSYEIDFNLAVLMKEWNQKLSIKKAGSYKYPTIQLSPDMHKSISSKI